MATQSLYRRYRPRRFGEQPIPGEREERLVVTQRGSLVIHDDPGLPIGVEHEAEIGAGSADELTDTGQTLGFAVGCKGSNIADRGAMKRQESSALFLPRHGLGWGMSRSLLNFEPRTLLVEHDIGDRRRQQA